MYMYIIHWYAYLSYISSCILYSFYGCFVYYWLFSAVFGFKKIIVVYVIKFNTCYVLFWGEGVSLILSLVMLRLLVVFSYIIRLSFVFVILYKLMVLEYVFCKALFKWLYTVHNSFINSNNTVTEWLRFVLD